MSDSGRMSSMSRSGHEEALQEHYNVLKAFLASYLRDEAGNSKRTKAKAKDKLLRLSATQFQELSTDVYDELLRREDERLRRVPNVPRYLLPRNNFHPKRNQARQKLSTLPQEKFLLLATDVFYELERRFPRFAGGDNDQVASPAVSVGSSQRAPSRNGPSNGMPNGMRPPPSGSGGMRGPPMPNAQSPTLDGSTYQPQSLRGSGNGPRPAPGPRSGSDNSAGNDLGRPLPQTLQSNTIIANKSTMVEDDESEEEDDTFGLEKVINGIGRGSVDRNVDSGTDKEALRAYESQVKELRETVNVLEEKLRVKEADHDRLQTLSKKRDAGIDTERDEWSNMRNDLEKQVSEAQDLAATLQTQLEQARQSNNKAEADMRAGMEHTVSSLQLRVDELTADNNRLRSETRKAPGSDSDEWRQRYNDLQDELVDQQKLTEDVRHQATQFLQEMRTLSEQSEAALEKEERLRCQVASLEAEIQEWKTRYAKTKTQLRTLKATSTGPPLKQISSGALDARQDLVSGSGLVNDVDVTKFQMAIEELVHAARDASSETVIDRMKDVVHCVRAITAGDESETQGLASPILSGSMSLHPDGTSFSSSTPKGRVLVEAKHLITAARNYASANGLSPVSLLDAATGNLTAAVVEYLRQAGIKPTPARSCTLLMTTMTTTAIPEGLRSRTGRLKRTRARRRRRMGGSLA
ncbi:component of the polarisome [Taxawa tesnikishii (nom. ined.)]|nr:component of the polarisome [Dothideales sp. JES 119]